MNNEQELTEAQRQEISARKVREAKSLTGSLHVPTHTGVGCGNAISNSGTLHQQLSAIDAYAQRVREKHEARDE